MFLTRQMYPKKSKEFWVHSSLQAELPYRCIALLTWDSTSICFLYLQQLRLHGNYVAVVATQGWVCHRAASPPALTLVCLLQPNFNPSFWKPPKAAVLLQFAHTLSLLLLCFRLTFLFQAKISQLFWGHGWEDTHTWQDSYKSFTKELWASPNLGKEHKAKEVILVSALHLLQSLNNLANLA